MYFLPYSEHSIVLSRCVQGMTMPKEKHRGKKASRDQKTVFASFEFCFFVVCRQWTGLAGPIWQRCIRSLCAGGPGQAAWARGSEVNGLQEERSVCGGIINNILSAFCVKFADFFSLTVPVVFRLLFLQSDAECGTAAIFGACFNDSRSSFVNFWSTLLGAVWKLRAKSCG